MFGRDDENWYGAAIDSRVNCSRSLFFAIKGENTDGHRFVNEALSKGGAAAIVEQEAAAGDLRQAARPFFLVRNTVGALQDLATAYRNTLDIQVVAITGSSGKTTTKEFMRTILKTKFRIHSNPGNLNNHIGVPLTILMTDHENQYLIAEVAANHMGEIDFLARMLKPDVGVITNVGDAHIGLFGSRDKVAEAKAELLESIDTEGHGVLPGDDAYIDFLKEKARCRVMTFGVSNGSTFKISSIEPVKDQVKFMVNEEELIINSVALHDVLNATAAFAVANLCGVDADSSRQALLNAVPLPGRGRIHRVGGIVIIDDSYNANPTSMRAALKTLSQLRAKRRIAVLGDMAELGDYSESAHKELGGFIARSDIDRLHWLGPQGPVVESGIASAGGRVDTFCHARWQEVASAVSSELRSGDSVLVKASRVFQLDKVVDELKRAFSTKDET
jgi:UDP-N-acetylmuramoyl-tripeptide--D-alanyl-D-alanine ligase